MLEEKLRVTTIERYFNEKQNFIEFYDAFKGCYNLNSFELDNSSSSIYSHFKIEDFSFDDYNEIISEYGNVNEFNDEYKTLKLNVLKLDVESSKFLLKKPNVMCDIILKCSYLLKAYFKIEQLKVTSFEQNKHSKVSTSCDCWMSFKFKNYSFHHNNFDHLARNRVSIDIGC